MAHQTHALPWNTLASNFKYDMSYHTNPQGFDIHPLKKPTQAKELAYFTQAFAKQLYDFSVAERAKYEPADYFKKRAATWVMSEEPNSEPGRNTKGDKKRGQDSKPETRRILPDDVWQCHNGDTTFFTTGCSQQHVEAWLIEPDHGYNPYGSWIAGGDILKLLMMEASGASPALSFQEELKVEEKERKKEAMETLLLMANHPRMQILALRNMHWGHHFGVSRVAEEAIKAYIYLNLLVAMRESGSDVGDVVDGSKGKGEEGESKRKYMDCESYSRTLRSVAGSYDGDAQTLVHREFFLGGFNFAYGYREKPERDVLGDMERVREYLKGVWRVMVTYDVVIREAGGDPTWETECENAFSDIFGIYHGFHT